VAIRATQPDLAQARFLAVSVVIGQFG
jgi:hypothetical protein